MTKAADLGAPPPAEPAEVLPDDDESLADVLDRLGGIPAERVLRRRLGEATDEDWTASVASAWNSSTACWWRNRREPGKAVFRRGSSSRSRSTSAPIRSAWSSAR